MNVFLNRVVTSLHKASTLASDDNTAEKGAPPLAQLPVSLGSDAKEKERDTAMP